MKNTLLFSLLLFIQISFSQITFDQGYFINNNNEKTGCLIKNYDWKNNPSQLSYRLSEGSEVTTVSIHDIKEFGVDNFSKYVKAIVDIDRSSDNTNDLHHSKSPVFVKETLFLGILIEGNANLYYYEDSSLKRYFFRPNSTSPIKQLVHKSYKTINNQVGYNNNFRVQLWNSLKKNTISMSDFEYLKYDKKDLIKIFEKYNGKKETVTTNFDSKGGKSKVTLSLKSGLRRNSLKIKDSRNEIFDLGNQSSIPFGVEVESIFGFNRNKWAVLSEISYQSYKSAIVTETATFNADYLMTADYKSIELAVGARHYMFLNQNSTIFLNYFFVFDFPQSSKFTSKRGFSGTSTHKSTKSMNEAFGVGYKYKNKYSIEVRTYSNRLLLHTMNSRYSSLSFVFGYTFF